MSSWKPCQVVVARKCWGQLGFNYRESYEELMGINTEYVLLMNQAAFWWATNGKQSLTQAALQSRRREAYKWPERPAARGSWCLCRGGISILIKLNRGLVLIEVIAFSMVTGFEFSSTWVLWSKVRWAAGRKAETNFLTHNRLKSRPPS